MKKRSTSDSYLQELRASKKLEENKKRKSKKTLPYKSRKLMSFISIGGRTANSNVSEEFVEVVLPKNFSIIENPEESLIKISEVAAQAKNTDLKRMKLNHSGINSHDLGAEVLLGEITAEIKRSASFRNKNVHVVGNLPNSERKKRLIRSLGVIKKLDIQDQSLTGHEDNIEIFDFHGMKDLSVSPGSEDRKNRCARLFVEHLNRCLAYNQKQLTDDSIQSLLGFVGEIVGNAEDHSGESKWYVSGYLDETGASDQNDPDMNELHFCEIVIFNFGRSIAQTFLELSQDSYAFSLIKPYIDAHKTKGYFSPAWLEEDLITLASLQSHISSKHLDHNSDRGQGTIDLIEFFQEVAEECAIDLAKHAKMCILSGKTHILFSDKYRLCRNIDGREVIAFNANNDLNSPPDKKYVKHLKNASFPGTIISIRFPLSSLNTEVSTVEAEG